MVTSRVCGHPTYARSVADCLVFVPAAYPDTTRFSIHPSLSGILLVAIASLLGPWLRTAARRRKRFTERLCVYLSIREAQRFAAGELTVTFVARRFCLHESTAGRLVTWRSRACHTIRSYLSGAHACPFLCNALSNRVIAAPLTRGGSDPITFRSLSKHRDFTVFLISLESISVMMKFSYGFPDFCERLFSRSEFISDFDFATVCTIYVLTPIVVPPTSEGYCCEATRRLDAFMARSYSHARMNPCAPGLCSSLCFWLIPAVA